MNTLSDTPRPAKGGGRTEDALLRAVADMRPGWTVLRDCALDDGRQGAPARARYALLHPDVGIALLDILPGTTTPDAPAHLRRVLDAAGFRSAFGGYPPVVYLCVPSRSLFGLDALLAREFDTLPPLTLAGGDAWVGAVQGVLTAEPPLRLPEEPTAAGRSFFPGLRRPAPPNLGLRGLAMFWGVVTLAFGGGALVLQSLGPPEGASAVAHAGGGPGPSEPQESGGVEGAWRAPSDSDKTRLPSPGPILALWPAERMQTRFDAPRADATGAGWGDPDRGGGRSAQAAAVLDGPQRPPVSAAASAGAHPALVGGIAAGAGGAGVGARAGGNSFRAATADGVASPSDAAGGVAGTAAAPTASDLDGAARADGAENGGARAQDLPRGPALEADVEAPDGSASAGNEAPPAALDASSLTTGTDSGPSASEAERDGGAAARAAGPVAPPASQPVASPSAGEVPPSAGDVRVPAPDEPRSARTREGDADAGAPPRPDAAGAAEVTGAAPPGTSPADVEPSTARGEDAAPARPPVAGGLATEPSAPARAATVPDTVPAVADTDKPATVPPPPAAQPPAAGPGTAEAEASPAPPALLQSPVGRTVERSGDAGPSAARRDAGPDVGPPPGPSVAPAAPPGAGVPVARPAARPAAPEADGKAAARPAAASEPDSKAPARAEGPERRAPAAMSVPPALVEALVSRGDAMVARRDISAARLLYERAAAAGDARAASALARTYDPAFLAEIGAQGIRGDAGLAATWYQKALSLGDSSALAKVEALNGAGAGRAPQGRP